MNCLGFGSGNFVPGGRFLPGGTARSAVQKVCSEFRSSLIRKPSEVSLQSAEPQLGARTAKAGLRVPKWRLAAWLVKTASRARNLRWISSRLSFLRKAVWRTFPNLEFMNCLGFGSGIPRGAGGKARSFAVRGRLRETPEGPRPEAGWRASLGRSAGILPSVPARAAGVPSPDLNFPACIVALGMEAASRFGRGRARSLPRKFFGSRSGLPKNFRAPLKSRPRLNGRQIAPRLEFPSGFRVEQFADTATARPPRGGKSLIELRSAAGTPEERCFCLV